MFGSLLCVKEGRPPPPNPHTHNRSALGCREPDCSLCSFNPQRVCERNFQKKYLVGDILKAKCGSSIRVELLDMRGNPVTQDYPDLTFEVGAAAAGWGGCMSREGASAPPCA